MLGPLQSSFPELPNWALTLSRGINLVVALVGFLIVYTAYKGYRRNQSRPMFFIAVGFALAVGIPFLLFPLVLLGGGQTMAVVITLVQNVSTLLGLLSILYALRMPAGEG